MMLAKSTRRQATPNIPSFLPSLPPYLAILSSVPCSTSNCSDTAHNLSATPRRNTAPNRRGVLSSTIPYRKGEAALMVREEEEEAV